MPYTVILADDEKTIREGIANNIDWNKLDLQLLCVADNGKTLLEMIEKHKPNIVITDIKMPLMDGISVIKSTAKYNISFVILSGYSDFDYAQEALKYGVCEYLLKPTDIGTLTNTLKTVVGQLDSSMQKEQLLNMLQSNFSNMKSLVRQQFIRDIIIGMPYTCQMYETYKNLLDLSDINYRLIVCVHQNENDMADNIPLLNYGELFLSKFDILLSTFIDDAVLFVVNDKSSDFIETELKKFKSEYKELYVKRVFVGVSQPTRLIDGRSAYLQIREYLRSSIFIDDSDIIFSKYSINAAGDRRAVKIEQYDKIVFAIQYNNVQEISLTIKSFFDEVKRHSYNNDDVRIISIEWVIRVVMQCGKSDSAEIIETISGIQKAWEADELSEFLYNCFKGIADRYAEHGAKSDERLVEVIKEYVGKEYTNAELTIKMIGEKMLFLTPDYIGRIFKNETGTSLNNYINALRIERAKILLKNGEYKIYQVAEMSGFGDNPQYFSQVFKKMVGVLPTEYK